MSNEIKKVEIDGEQYLEFETGIDGLKKLVKIVNYVQVYIPTLKSCRQEGHDIINGTCNGIAYWFCRDCKHDLGNRYDDEGKER